MKGIIRTTDALYDVSRCSVQFSMLVGKVFSTMMAVYQSCTLSPVLLDIYKKKDILQDHHTFMFIGWRPFSSLLNADNIELSGNKGELQTQMQVLKDGVKGG